MKTMDEEERESETRGSSKICDGSTRVLRMEFSAPLVSSGGPCRACHPSMIQWQGRTASE